MGRLSSRLLQRWVLGRRERVAQTGRSRAGALQAQLDEARHLAEARLQEERAAPFRYPPHCDWIWRPEVWTAPVHPQELAPAPSGSRFGTGLELFHDASRPALVLRQIRHESTARGTFFALLVETADVDGSYLSLALTLPEAAARGLKRRHVLALHLRTEDMAGGAGASGEPDGARGTSPGLSSPAPGQLGSSEEEDTAGPVAGAPPVFATSPAFARLNIRHGPNLEQLTRPLPTGGAVQIDFDLAGTGINEARVEHLWLDLIFERPARRRIRLHDLTLSRRPRAEF